MKRAPVEIRDGRLRWVRGMRVFVDGRRVRRWSLRRRRIAVGQAYHISATYQPPLRRLLSSATLGRCDV